MDQGRQDQGCRPFPTHAAPIVAPQKRSGAVHRHAKRRHPPARKNTIPIIPRKSRRAFVQSGFNEVPGTHRTHRAPGRGPHRSLQIRAPGRGPHRSLQIPKLEQIRFKADFWGSVMDCDELRDNQWEHLKGLVPGGAKASGCQDRTTAGSSTLCFGWRAQAGDGVTCLRDLGITIRSSGAITAVVLEAMFEALAREADMEWLMTDSTTVRAHQQAAGARRKKGGRMPRALAAPAVV